LFGFLEAFLTTGKKKILRNTAKIEFLYFSFSKSMKVRMAMLSEFKGSNQIFEAGLIGVQAVFAARLYFSRVVSKSNARQGNHQNRSPPGWAMCTNIWSFHFPCLDGKKAVLSCPN